MPFIRNAWYMAAHGAEIADNLLTRRLLDVPMVFWRSANGALSAAVDQCPHRFAPMHMGSKAGADRIECPYHGLQFDGSGRCVHNPHGDGKIPASARLKMFPVVERDSIVWFWPGDPEVAESARIPDFSWLEGRAGWAQLPWQMATFPVPMDLILDNLMDLTHGGYLHLNSVGSEAVRRGGRMQVEMLGPRSLMYKNLYPNGVPPVVLASTGGCPADELVDLFADVRWDAPSAMFFNTGAVPTGQDRRDDTNQIDSAQLLTPESTTRTHYFWRIARNFRVDDGALNAAMALGFEHTFHGEDEPILKAVHERMAGRDLYEMAPVLLQTDACAVRVRRILQQMLEAERTHLATPA